MCGGTDVDAAFRWMIGKAGGGDFVVIRATGTDAYNPYIYGLGTVDSVETVIIKNRAAASDAFVMDKIRNAEALFIAGGRCHPFSCHMERASWRDQCRIDSDEGISFPRRKWNG